MVRKPGSRNPVQEHVQCSTGSRLQAGMWFHGKLFYMWMVLGVMKCFFPLTGLSPSPTQANTIKIKFRKVYGSLLHKHLHQMPLSNFSLPLRLEGLLLNRKSTLLQCVTKTEQKRSRVSAIGRNLWRQIHELFVVMPHAIGKAK